MSIDPSLIFVAATALTVTLLGLLFDYLKQSVLIAYLLAGVVLGPFVLGIFQDPTVLDPLAGLGLVLLLFFIGMELDLRQLTSQWRIAIFGCLIQTIASVGLTWAIGHWLGWPPARIVLMGFVLSLSSTPIALRILASKGLLNTRLGANTVGILIAQDLLAIPMLIVLGTFEGESPSIPQLALQISGGILLISIVILATRHQGFSLPLSKRIERSRELQVLAALALCFGMAMLTGFMQLSVVLGGFFAGLLIRLSNSLDWVHSALEPFSLSLVAIFFVSIGVLIDIEFLLDRMWSILALTFIGLVVNTLVNAATLAMLGERFRDAALAGASLAQLGEFGFILAALGLASGIIGEVGYQYVLAVTAMSWLLSPLWILAVDRLTRYRRQEVRTS